MKSSALVLAVIGAVSGFVGAAVAVLTLGDRPAVTNESVAAGPSSARPAAPESDADRAARVQAQLAAHSQAAELATLQRRVDLLEDELAALSSDRSRSAVASVAQSAPKAPTPEALADIQRDAIVQVLEDQRKAEQEKREAERKERQRKAADEMAARTAKELGLGAGDERRLSDFYVAAGEKRDELFRPMRDGAGFDRDTIRQSFEDYRTWSESELKTNFGDNIGSRIIEYQRQQRDFGGFGGFGGGPGGGFGGPPGGGGNSSGGGDSGRRGGRGGG